MRTRLVGAAVWAALVILLSATSTAAAERHILLLQSLDRGNLTLDYFTGSFRSAIDGATSEPVTVTQFVVNPSGFDEVPEQAFVQFLRTAFANRAKPDLIMTSGGTAATFARKYRKQLFPESPLLFAAVDQRFLQGAALADNETSVAVLNDMPGIVDGILQLFPRTSHVFMVTGAGPLGTFWQQRLERDFQRFDGRVRFIWSDQLSLGEILQRIAALPANSAIFYLWFGTDNTGGAYSEERILAEIHEVTNAPIFGGQSTQLGYGIVGGRLTSVDELGRVAANVALRILNGESPGSIKTPLQLPGPPVFDWRELNRWGINESSLPRGSVVRFREPGAWDRYKWTIIGGSSVVIAQAILIGRLAGQSRSTTTRRTIAARDGRRSQHRAWCALESQSPADGDPGGGTHPRREGVARRCGPADDIPGHRSRAFARNDSGRRNGGAAASRRFSRSAGGAGTRHPGHFASAAFVEDRAPGACGGRRQLLPGGRQLSQPGNRIQPR